MYYPNEQQAAASRGKAVFIGVLLLALVTLLAALLPQQLETHGDIAMRTSQVERLSTNELIDSSREDNPSRVRSKRGKGKGRKRAARAKEAAALAAAEAEAEEQEGAQLVHEEEEGAAGSQASCSCETVKCEPQVCEEAAPQPCVAQPCEPQPCTPAAAPPATGTAGTAGGSMQPPAAPGAAQLVTRRPSRIPPGDAALEMCRAAKAGSSGSSSSAGRNSPPLGSAAAAFGFTATNGAFQEHTGQTLLGECTCPLRAGYAPAGWSFDCGAWDYRILSELAPWYDLTITHEMLDFAYNFNTANVPPGYHFSINKGRVYYRMRDPLSAYHHQLLDFLNTVAAAVPLPDVEFVMHAWDHAKVWRQDPSPVFAFIRDAGKTDVTLPYVYKWNAGSHDFDTDRGGSCQPWEARTENKVTWRGGCTGPAVGYTDPLWQTYLRYRATTLTRSHPDTLDAGLSEPCVNVGRAGQPLQRLDLVGGACNFKHLLLLDGNTASGRSSAWFHSGAVIFKPDSVFSEHYYHLLQPWVHYVPVREYLEDLPEVAEYVLGKPELGKCIADNAAAFAAQHLNRASAICYMHRLLSAWAKQQPQGSRTEGFMPA